jgi:hypothetical protein
VPKYGASKREAESSTASEQAPATNTSSISNQPCNLRPEVETTAPSSTDTFFEPGVVVDNAKFSLSMHIDRSIYRIVAYLKT